MEINRRALAALLACFWLAWGQPGSLLAETTVLVGNVSDRHWKEKVAYDIGYVNRFLCAEFTQLPEDVRVFRSFRSPEYDMALGTIFVDETYIPVEMYHEYAHKVMDSYLSRKSTGYRYYNLRKAVAGNPLHLAIRDLELEIEDDREYLLELRRKSYRKMAANLGRSIASSEKLLNSLKAESASEPLLSSMYERYAGETDAPSLYQLIGPYHELFADSLSVLITHSWDAIYMAQSDRLRRTDGELSFVAAHPEISTEQFLAYRAFKQGLKILDYPFSEQEATSNYTQFVPVRSYIRQLAEGRFSQQPVLLLKVLADAIIAEIEQRLRHPDLYEMGLLEKNLRLRGQLDSQIKSLNWALQKEERSVCSIAREKHHVETEPEEATDSVAVNPKSLRLAASGEEGS